MSNPAATISPSQTTFNEGETLSASISTTDLGGWANYYYSITGDGLTNSDFNSGLTGQVYINGAGEGSISNGISNDALTEGDESLTIHFFTDSARTNQIGQSSSILIKDTSNNPAATISPSQTTFNEGETLSASISTTDLGGWANYYYSITGDGLTNSDFNSGLTGQVYINGAGEGSISNGISNDALTEGDESLTIHFFTDSARTNQIGQSSSILIKDTSNNPAATISPSQTTFNEGETLSASISTTDLGGWANYYYSITGDGLTNSDFNSGLTGQVYINGAGEGSISNGISNDALTEGDESLTIHFFTDSARTNQIGQSSSILIKDTSNTPDFTDPSLSSSSPTDNATAVAVSSNIVLTFSEAVDVETGNILIKKSSDNSTVESIDVTSNQVTGSGTTQITINPSSDLASATQYYIQIPATAFDDSSSNSYAGITDTTSLSFTTADVISPSLSSASPADNATAVGISSNIVLTFSEAVDIETGNILIKKSSDNSTVESIDVTSNQVTGSGTTQITINPSSNLDSATQYYIQIPATAFDDSSSNSYAGITDTTSLSFTTADVISPSLSSASPADNATSVGMSSNIILTFSEAVDVETGNILIKRSSDNSTVESIDVTGNQVTGSGTTQITINPSSDLASSTQYYVQIPTTAFDDSSSNSYAGITDTTSLSFTTADEGVPTLANTTPSYGATNTTLDSNIVLTFSEAVDVKSGNILIKKSSDNSTVESIDVTSNQVTGSGTTQITINPSSNFASATQYYVQIPGTVFDDAAGNSYAGITDTTSLVFTTADRNDPIITGPSGETSSSSSVSITENTTSVHIFSANETVTWSIRSGADRSLFSIDPTTGALVFLAAPDFDNPTDTDQNNSYEVTVSAKDSSNNIVDQTVTIAVLEASAAIDLTGTNTSDTLTSTAANENIDGGAGNDTVVFTGTFSDYSFTRRTSSITIVDQRTGTNDGTDTLSNIEYIQFSDQTVDEAKVDVVKTYSGNFRDYKFYNKGNGSYEIKKSSTGTTDDITGYPSLQFTEEATTSSFRDVSGIADIKGVFDQVTGLNTDSGEMFRLYNAAFARFPDADGLEYWIEEFSSGRNTRRVVAESFLLSEEFGERYGTNVSNAKFVETLYINILGREYDQEGYNYWLGNLNSGLETRYELLLGFAENDENLNLFTEMTGLS